MRHLQGSGMWFQVASRSGYRTFRVNVATSILYTVADLFLVNIQSDVIHSLHGGASLVVSESAWSLSSAFVHQAPLHRLIHSNKSPRTSSLRFPELRLRRYR